MTIGKFFGFGLALGILLVVAKLLAESGGYFGDFTNSWPVWLVSAILVIGFSRRLGPINFLEAIALAVAWFVIQLALDLVIVGPIVGYKIFLRPEFVLLYLFSAILIFFGHQKKHVAVRKELREARAKK